MRDGSVAGVGSHKLHNTGESAIEGQRKAGSRSQYPKGLARLTNSATPSMPPHSQANRVLLRPSGVRAQGAVPCSGRKIAPACEVKFLRSDTTARDQADRSDNTASRVCRSEVSAEHHRRGRPYLAKDRLDPVVGSNSLVFGCGREPEYQSGGEDRSRRRGQQIIALLPLGPCPTGWSPTQRSSIGSEAS